MKPVRIDERFSICGQIRAKDVDGIARAGYATVIINRPDREIFWQPKASAIASAAVDAGLGCVHIPVRGPDTTEQTIRTFQKACAESAGPILAFCASGTRSLCLWAIGEVLDGRIAKADLKALRR